MAMNTKATERQRTIEAKQKKTDELAATIYWMRIAALPRSHSLPLSQLWISSGTGYRTNPMGGTEEKLHDGTDFAAPEGTPVHAVQGGVVATHYVPPDGGIWKGHPVYGGMIEIECEDELLFRYGHLSKSYVHEGDVVQQGDVIGLVGSTGMSTAPHLHLQVIVSPMKYLEERK